MTTTTLLLMMMRKKTKMVNLKKVKTVNRPMKIRKIKQKMPKVHPMLIILKVMILSLNKNLILTDSKNL